MRRCTQTCLDHLGSHGSASVDAILLDVCMPGISGYEVCSTIRRRYPHDLIPIIMISAKKQDIDLAQAWPIDTT